MLARIRKANEKSDAGFTLVELLVVMIIIGILAAIAIPTFLNQRKNGYRAAARSDLRNAATNVESWAVEQGGTYQNLTTVLLTGPVIGAKASAPEQTLTAPTAVSDSYCLQIVDTRLPGETWRFRRGPAGDSGPVQLAC